MKLLEILRTYVNAIMEDKYEEGTDLFDMYTIVVGELITDYNCGAYILRVYGSIIRKFIEEWIAENTNN